MDATPILTSGPVIAVHALSALGATLLGTIVLFLRKGTRLHKFLGRIWVAIMALVALSSFLITEMRMFGPYSLIHALSIFTLFALAGGVLAIRRGNVIAHRSSMISLYVFALLLTGAEAEAAAADRGHDLDTDYFIVNDSTTTRTVIVPGDADVQVLAGGGAELTGTNVADFEADRNPERGVWITIADGLVTAIEEQYLP
jgi:uncharacterized membrane protein